MKNQYSITSGAYLSELSTFIVAQLKKNIDLSKLSYTFQKSKTDYE